MTKTGKRIKVALEKVEPLKEYDLTEALNLAKEAPVKFDESVDVAVRLGVDTRKADQMVRGTVALPHGTGRDLKVLVLCTPDKVEEAKAAGADHVGLEEYVEKIVLLKNNPNLHKKISTLSIKKMETEYNFLTISKELQKIYLSI